MLSNHKLSSEGKMASLNMDQLQHCGVSSLLLWYVRSFVQGHRKNVMGVGLGN